ncbi:hypothetical protein SAMN06297251_103125 [Fulvimarina manganoxydans]|uniref:Uncharacterized protein n=1 Tax=Fulvimarina manganoxydans TaxID=937218 RepID=A0A1W1ZTF9_9HYPH|nr:hypothetical protein [Fulvimarina manganoxydans]SMC51765.1 hypothetical protein SAMN06297251_103125 [Fulvimarina manganoxydans]
MPTIYELGRSMRDRMPWTVGRKILEQHDVSRGRGWDNTLEKLADEDIDFSGVIEPVRLSLFEHTLCGEKLSRFYRVDSRTMSEFREAAFDLRPNDSIFRDKFPIVVDEDDLRGAPLGHTLIDVSQTDTGTAIIFSSVRSVMVREELHPEDFPLGSAAAKGNYDEIIGIKNKRVQGLDIVWLPEQGDIAEVRVDYPHGMLRNAGEYAHDKVRSHLMAELGRDYLGEPINLFPLISRMYHDHAEGSVVELAFGTTTASLKHEKMRRGSISLRDERYHRGGLAALSAPISPFKVSIEWERAIDERMRSKPELNLHSNSRTSGSEQPVLLDAVIRNCMGVEDYEFVRGRILQHLASVISLESAEA